MISNIYSTIRNAIVKIVYWCLHYPVMVARKLGVTPNMVTTLGLLGNIAGAALVVKGGLDGDPSMIGWAGLVIILSSIMDMVDGYMARTYNLTSTFGAFYDSVLDRYCELVTLSALAFYFMQIAMPMAAVVTFVSLIGSIMVSYVRARAEGLDVECKVGLMQRPERVVLTVAGMLLAGLLDGVVEFDSIWFVIVTQIIIAVFANITAFHRILHVKGKMALVVMMLMSMPTFMQAEEIDFRTEIEGSFSDGNTPLWLNANKYGLSSLSSTNGYLRMAAEHRAETDTTRLWRWGYGLDVALPLNYTSKFVIQQAFAELQYKKGSLTIGQREQPMRMVNNQLSSGAQTFGKNARPIPQIRLELPDYVTFIKGWFGVKAHLSYGFMTDGNFQTDFAGEGAKYTRKVLYHEKSGFLRIGNPEKFPLTFEAGLEMAAQFGGEKYRKIDGVEQLQLKGNADLKAFLNAFVAGGSDATDGDIPNVEGNHLGSDIFRLKWDDKKWSVAAYLDHYFEDHSAMYQLNHDGFGEGIHHTEKVRNRWLLYDFKDMLLGVEFNFKKFKPVSGIVVEYLYSMYQSGPLYHDHTTNISDHIAGMDNYYNHGNYSGWHHWGQVIGNPLYRSPINNTDGDLVIQNNRMKALHVGMNGAFCKDNIRYRLLFSTQKGLGTYGEPYFDPQYNTSAMAECIIGGGILEDYVYEQYADFVNRLSLRIAFGMDRGKLLGDNTGGQVTIGYRHTFK